jgi:hypothetical protein
MAFSDDKSEEPRLKFAFSERLRLETWDNTIGFDSSLADENTYTRTRTSLTTEWKALDTLLLVCKITNEFRYYFAPDDREFTINEFFFDQLYVKAINPFGLTGSLTVGRQDIRFGEGFVVMDGGPLDGSRSAYFNGIKLDYQVCPQNILSMFYVYQSPTDRMLPKINGQEQKMIEQPEEGYALFFSGSIGNLKYEPYYIHKNIYETSTLKEESSIETLGLRALVPLSRGLEFTVEAASQWGTKGDTDRKALGGYFHLDYKTGGSFPLPELITLGGIYLTGDDPNTSEWEAWDPLFSRWPKWSESLIYAFIKESKVAYWSNFKSVYASLRIPLWVDSNLNLTYHFLGADEPAPTGSVFPGGAGTDRGNLFIARLNFKILPELSGHIVWEHLTPGDFYSSGADSYNWFRTELFLQL